ncbi:MAG: class I mannose-6-phosphate isomerase [Prevotellaceae bacterium]|jgi:mannose-6-phosphate isomerase|nr:class I mannose-6-phosphate isomerase [Prevotellaceae bacterium]
MIPLYPLKFKPLYIEKIWGGDSLSTKLDKAIPSCKIGESWELSGISNFQSIVDNGGLAGNTLLGIIQTYGDQVLGVKVLKKFGVDFSLLIKFIDAQDDLSVQVHPNDEQAKILQESYGKTEMWYVMDAEPGATLISGFNIKLSVNEYQKLVARGELLSVLQHHEVKRGDVFFIPAGLIHAIGRGILLAEIQQSSDITYRVYDYNRIDVNGTPRELHAELALQVINFDIEGDKVMYDASQINQPVPLVSCEYFTTNLLRLTKRTNRDYRTFDSFIIYICTHGSGSIVYGEERKINIFKGETLLIPASIKDIYIEPNFNIELLEVYI